MVSRESWLKLGENGFLGMQVPEEYGGLGIDDFRYNAIFTEVIAQSGCAGPAVGYPLHNDIVLPYILAYASEETKKKYVPKTVSGEHILAIAMTEPGAGSDLQGMRATAEDKRRPLPGKWFQNLYYQWLPCRFGGSCRKNRPFAGSQRNFAVADGSCRRGL